jgi:hypothetical protein
MPELIQLVAELSVQVLQDLVWQEPLVTMGMHPL